MRRNVRVLHPFAPAAEQPTAPRRTTKEAPALTARSQR